MSPVPAATLFLCVFGRTIHCSSVLFRHYALLFTPFCLMDIEGADETKGMFSVTGKTGTLAVFI